MYNKSWRAYGTNGSMVSVFYLSGTILMQVGYENLRMYTAILEQLLKYYYNA